LAGVAAGCGSSDSSSTSSASTDAASSGASTTASTTSGDGGGDPAALEAALKGPTEWQGPTEPVKAPSSFKLALITCDNASEGCLAPAKGAQQAAEALGWTATIYDGQSDPTVQAKRVQQAIASGADGIITESVDGRSITSGLKDAKAAGIPVVSTSNAAAPGEQGYEVDVSPDFDRFGRDIANWMMVDSSGKANVLPYVDREYQSTVSTLNGLVDQLKACSTCTVESPVNFVAKDVASNLGPQTVSDLRAHPKVDYVHFAFDPAATVQVPAIMQAGLGDKIKASSIIGGEQNLQFIADGQVQAADAVWDNTYQGWASVDQLIRLATNQPPAVSEGVPDRFKFNENLPSILITKDNLPADGKTYTAPFDYQSEYKKLWGIG
jgi:ribose transport system substrate-binding protein